MRVRTRSQSRTTPRIAIEWKEKRMVICRNATRAAAALLVVMALLMSVAIADIPPNTWWTNLTSGTSISVGLEETDSITICDKAAQFYTERAADAGSADTFHAGPPNVCCGSTPTTSIAGPPRGQYDFRICRIYRDGGSSDGEYKVHLVPNQVAFFVSIKKQLTMVTVVACTAR